MKVAAYQAPLASCDTVDAVRLIREQVVQCESLGVEILCCPEGILGGLADYHMDPFSIAIDAEAGELHDVLSPLASETVTTILGFTELARDGRLYNAAAIFHRGSVLGVYRKLYPAINRSVYHAGRDMPVFMIGALTFGIMICRDSTFPEPARVMASRGATALFIPTNNGLPPSKGGKELVAEARNSDIACAVENTVSIVRADVAGRAGQFVSYGSSGIVSRNGSVLTVARELESQLLVAEIDVPSNAQNRRQ
jgi:predicted amidohydrolase